MHRKLGRVRPTRCYIAGPMRGRPEYNYPAFHAAAEALRLVGWYVYNPAEMDMVRDTGAQEYPAHFRSLRRYAERDLGVIHGKLRGECGDAIVLLPGWETSAGAQAEHATAKWVNLRVLTLVQALKEGTPYG